MNGPFSPCGQWFGSLHGQFWAFKARWPSTANRHNWKDDHQNENRFENHTHCRSEKSCHHPSCSGLSKKLIFLITFFDITDISEPQGKVEKIKEDSLDLIPSLSMKIQIMGGRVCSMFCLITSSKLSCQ